MFTFEIMSQQVLNGLITGSSYILIALGLTLIFGVYRLINMAHGAVYMWGAFFCQIFATRLGLNMYLAALIAMVLAGVLSVLLERCVFRKVKGSADWVALVAGLGIYYALENIGWIVLGPRELHIHALATQHTIRFMGLYANLQKLILAGLCFIIVVAMVVVLKKTSMGRAIRASSSDPEAALLVGINTNRISIMVFFLGGAFAAAAGSLVGSLNSVSPVMGFGPMIMAFVIVVFGGMGSILGTVIAGLMVGVLQNVLAFAVAPTFAYTFTMLTLLVIFIARPTGLFGEKK
jgi:branched-chain amino acid transport system permease protein